MKVKLLFTVTYETTIKLEEGEDASAAAEVFNSMDLIPETENCTYYPNSCQANMWVDECGHIHECKPKTLEQYEQDDGWKEKDLYPEKYEDEENESEEVEDDNSE